MDLPEILEHTWIVFTTLFDFAAIFLLFFLLKTKRRLIQREKAQRQKIYQIKILKEIQDRIGYSLDVEQIIDVITGSLKNLFPYSTASSMVLKQEKIVFKTNLEESVNNSFVQQMERSMLASLAALVPNLPGNIERSLTGVALDENGPRQALSFFHIPLIVNNRVLGIINVSSIKPNLYKEEEMTILYQMADQASSALSKLEEVLESEKGKLTSMIRGLADGVFMVDTNNQLLIVNEAAENFLNLTPNNSSFTEIVTALKGQLDIAGKIETAIKEIKTIEEKEIAVNESFFQVFIAPVKSTEKSQQKVVGASVLLHDITIEKKINQIKEDFTNMMVHDIRAPLTAVKASSELILDKEKNLSQEETQTMLAVIQGQSRRLLDQIGTILDAAKIESGSFTIRKAPSSITNLISQSIEDLEPLALKKNIVLETDVESNIPEIDCDGLRIIQVLNNLISNSLKFTQEGGKIIVSAKLKDNLTITVSDNGIGIPKDEQEDLFSKFYQIRRTPSELAKKGTGLGLYIVKGIVEAHGGAVSAQSDEGKGTSISFTLPVNHLLDEKNKEKEEAFSNLQSQSLVH